VAEDDYKTTNDEEQAEVALVVDGPGDDACKLKQEALDRADLGDVDGGGLEKLAGLIVGLED